MTVYGGHTHIVRLCHKYGKVEIDKVMVWVAQGGHEEFVSRLGC